MTFDPDSVRAAWDAAADTFAHAQTSGRDFYRYEFFGPAQVAACGDVTGLRLLDVGCGSGYFAREMATGGARVTGIDISARMIEHARRQEAAAPLGIEYDVGDAADLSNLPPQSFDMVTSCVALQDMPAVPGVLCGVRSVLRPAGRFVASIAHPCTDTPFREWECDTAGNKRWLSVDRYFDRRRIDSRWDWGSGFTTAAMHAPLEDWLAWILDAGFVLRDLREPRPTGAALGARPALEDAARVPYFVIFDLQAGPDVSPGSRPQRPGDPAARADDDDSSTRSWDAVADDWVAHADTNDYRNDFLLPRTLMMLGDVRRRRILDLGCGEGGYSRELARRGARVTGVDGSERLIEIARRRAHAAGIEVDYRRANASALKGLPQQSFDLVLASMSLMDVEDYPGAVREAHRVLEPGGELLMSITPPCYSAPVSRWLRDDAGRPRSFAVDRYFDRACWEDFITPRFRSPVIRRHRPIEDYVAAPLEVGLELRQWLEPSATPEERAKSARFEYLTRIPYFLFMRWQKR